MKKKMILLFAVTVSLTVNAQSARWQEYQRQVKPLYESQAAIKSNMMNWYGDYQKRVKEQGAAASTKDDTLKAQSFQAQWDAQEAIVKRISLKYMQDNPNDTLALTLWSRVFNNYNLPDSDLTAAKNIIAKAGPMVKKSRRFKPFVTYITGKDKFRVGQQFTDFEMPDTLGHPHKLSDYAGKGKFVYVDFWASWCGPCRAEIPNVKKAYADFKDKGFDVVSVSLDEGSRVWRYAIKAHDMPWTQLSDLKGFKSPAAQAYGITAIPATLLIDPTGIIVGTNLRGSQLSAEIQKLMKK